MVLLGPPDGPLGVGRMPPLPGFELPPKITTVLPQLLGNEYMLPLHMSPPPHVVHSQKHLQAPDVSVCQKIPSVGTISPILTHLPLQASKPRMSERSTGSPST
jgi:hypothetical protein